MRRVVIGVLALCLTVLAAGCTERPRLETAVAEQQPYVLGSGDRLRVTVFNQPTLSASYSVDASGVITMPLLGPVEAGGRTTFELQRAIEARLAKDFLREPDVSVEVETYRPFFVYGEVTQGGQYPYVAGMTVEQAIAIAGGYTPRANRNSAQLARRDQQGVARVSVPLTTIVQPGDTVYVKERWF
jgi:polysaccharide export outer membrane protein